MTGPEFASRTVGLSGPAMDQLMPMHLWIDPSGQVRRAGPTLTKLAAAGDVIGRDVFELIEFRRMQSPYRVADLLALEHQRLSLRLRSMGHLPLRGMVVRLPAETGALINISLGVSFAQAVEERRLTLSDFSPCDQTVDLLYMREAVAATAHESKRWTQRLIEAERAAGSLARTDPLTGLANRRAMDEHLLQATQGADPVFWLLHIDLDKFKAVNDHYGHAAGDAVLERVGRILRRATRASDLAARIGGDEFLVLLDGIDRPDIARDMAERLIVQISEPVYFDGHWLKIGASIGGVRARDYETLDLEVLLRHSDEALYASKAAGRGRYQSYRAPNGAPDGAPDSAQVSGAG